MDDKRKQHNRERERIRREADRDHFETFYSAENLEKLIDMLVMDGESFQQWADRLMAKYGKIPYVRPRKDARPLGQSRDAYERWHMARHPYPSALVALGDSRVADTVAAKNTTALTIPTLV